MKMLKTLEPPGAFGSNFEYLLECLLSLKNAVVYMLGFTSH